MLFGNNTERSCYEITKGNSESDHFNNNHRSDNTKEDLRNVNTLYCMYVFLPLTFCWSKGRVREALQCRRMFCISLVPEFSRLLLGIQYYFVLFFLPFCWSRASAAYKQLPVTEKISFSDRLKLVLKVTNAVLEL